MKDKAELLSLVPISKSSRDAHWLRTIEDLQPSDLALIASDLWEWTKDSNWPVAEPICSALVKLGEGIVPFVRSVLLSNDDEWVWHLVHPLLMRLEQNVQKMILPDVLRYLTVPHAAEYDEVIEEFLDHYVEGAETEPGVVTVSGRTGRQLQGDLLVHISYLKTEHGGKAHSITSGYRGQFFYDNHDWDADQQFLDNDTVDPGDSVRAAISFVSPDKHLGKLAAGTHFLIREGQKVCGHGHVERLLNLESSAIRMARWRLRHEKVYRM